MTGLGEILNENSRLRHAYAALEAAHAQALAEHEAKTALLEAKLKFLTDHTSFLERQLDLIRLKQSGPATQRYVPDLQTPLPFPGDVPLPPRSPQKEDEQGEEEESESDRRARRRRANPPKRRRREDFDHLPSRNVNCPVDPAATCKGCGGSLKVIGQATSFRVEWVPGHFVVEDVIRDKCTCPNCPQEGVLTVPGPYALDRALCGNSLLSRVLVDKFADHLPLNRQARRMEREGFEVGTHTLSGWVLEATGLLSVIAKTIKDQLLAGPVLQGDDSGFPVQDTGDGTLRKGRFWAFTDQVQAWYAFTDTKEGEHPARLLGGFDGKLLLVDGGSEFNKVVEDQELERAGCWSHLRTYFFDARHYHPAESAAALGTIRDLFLIERTLNGAGAEEIQATRNELSRPLVDGFFTWIRDRSTSLRPKSALAEAFTYAHNQEERLRRFLDRPELPIHNNLSELLLRQLVVGRKNWLFARSEGGAHAAATMYTLIGSCFLQGVDPHAYLTDVLARLPDHPRNRVSELTPAAWRAARELRMLSGG